MGCGASTDSKRDGNGKAVPVPKIEDAPSDDASGDNSTNGEAGAGEAGSSSHRGTDQTQRGENTNGSESTHQSQDPRNSVGKAKDNEGKLPSLKDRKAEPAHFYYVFDRHPVIRPGCREFLEMLAKYKAKGEVKRVYIYTANTSLHWVRFIMQCIMKYYSLDLSIIDGIKHAPGGLKVVPENAVLYDDHPENSIGTCVAVDPYTNEVPWEVLEPILQMLPDHAEDVCPCWEQCCGLQAFIDRDKACKDREHDPATDGTLYRLCKEFVPIEEVLLDMDETLIAGARVSAYYNALNHFLGFRNKELSPSNCSSPSNRNAPHPSNRNTPKPEKAIKNITAQVQTQQLESAAG